MPTYEYLCTDCGNRVEVVQRIGDEPPTVCEVCGGPLRKVFHPAGIVFKGSGFYATDSRSRSKSSADGGAKKDSGTSGDAGKTSEGTKGSKGSEGSATGGAKESAS